MKKNEAVKIAGVFCHATRVDGWSNHIDFLHYCTIDIVPLWYGRILHQGWLQATLTECMVGVYRDWGKIYHSKMTVNVQLETWAFIHKSFDFDHLYFHEISKK